MTQRFTQTLILCVLITNGLVFSVSLVASSYMGIDLTSGLLGPKYDAVGFERLDVPKKAGETGMTWDYCNRHAEEKFFACKKHFFGDFWHNYEVNQSPNPWNASGENPNFQMPNFLTKVLTYFDYFTALTIFFVLASLALLAPAVHALSDQSFPNKLMITLVLVIFTHPFFYSLDRGNTQAFVPLFIYFAFCSKSTNVRIVSASLLFCWKIHTWPIALLFLVREGSKRSFMVFALCVTLTLAISLAWQAPLQEQLVGISKSIFSMTSANGDLGLYLWRNISLTGFLTLLSVVLNVELLALVIAKNSTVISLVWVLFVLPLLFSKHLPDAFKLLAVCSIMIMAVPRGYPYGLSFMMAIIPMIIWQLNENTANLSPYQMKQKQLLEGYLRLHMLPIVLAMSVLLGFDFAIGISPEVLQKTNVTMKSFTAPMALIVLILTGYSAHFRPRPAR